MSEVAQAGQARAPLAQHRGGHPEVEAGGREAVRALGDEAHRQRAENEQSAFFWFFNPTNFEMGVKAVDACVPPFNHFWVFVSGLTSQGYDVTVTKMSDPSHPRIYSNPVDNIPTTEADTLAFTCP